jgi:plastocyanin
MCQATVNTKRQLIVVLGTSFTALALCLLSVALFPRAVASSSPSGVARSADTANTIQISITAAGFEPAVLTITAGTTTVWVNVTPVTQTLESGSQSHLYLPLILRGGSSNNT